MSEREMWNGMEVWTKIRLDGIEPELNIEYDGREAGLYSINLNVPSPLEDWVKLAEEILRVWADTPKGEGTP